MDGAFSVEEIFLWRNHEKNFHINFKRESWLKYFVHIYRDIIFRILSTTSLARRKGLWELFSEFFPTTILRRRKDLRCYFQNYSSHHSWWRPESTVQKERRGRRWWYGRKKKRVNAVFFFPLIRRVNA